MAEATINDTCIIGMPMCGYGFSSSRMAFIALPADEEFQLELDIIQNILKERDYEDYVAVQNTEPAKLAFCTKICSKIIISQFCIILINSSKHSDYPNVLIPNPNVHLEYGMMLSFKKHIIPFQLDSQELAFNIRPLDTIIYNKANFKEQAQRAIDGAIEKSSLTTPPIKALASNDLLLKYIAVRSLRIDDLAASEMKALFELGRPFGFNLLSSYNLMSQDIVYFGFFDQEEPKEIVFRVKMLVQRLGQMKKHFEEKLPSDKIEAVNDLWNRLRIEFLISKDFDKAVIESRIKKLTSDLPDIRWSMITQDDMKFIIDEEYREIGDL